jgi:protein-tyrosine kinase
MEKIKNAIEKAKSQSPSQTLGNDAVRPKRAGKDENLEIMQYTKTRVVELDPVILEKNRIIAFNKADPLTSVFDSLRTQVLQKMEENNWRTLAIVSPTQDSGKTLVSINLAISIAQQPQKSALLLDFDMRRPRVASYLGIKPEASIYDYLHNQAELADVMVNPGIPRLVILPSNRAVVRSSETLSTKNTQRLISELKDRYDSRVVIIDLPPILNADDALVVLPQVDCVLLVVSSGVNTKAELDESMRLLANYNLVGVTFNRTEAHNTSYYY